MSVAEEVGIRVFIQGRTEYLAGMDSVKKSLADFSGANKAAGDASKSMAGATQAQRDALKAVQAATDEAVASQKAYETALVEVRNAEAEAGAADTELAAKRKANAEASVAATKAQRDASLAGLSASKDAAKAEDDVAERTRLASTKKISAYEAFQQSSLGAMFGVQKASLGVAESEADNAAKIEAANARKVASFDAMGSKFGMVGAGMVGVAAVAGGASVKMAADFQSSTQRLVSSAGETEQNLDMVRQGMLTMAGQVGFSAEQLSTAMYKIESGGQHGADGLNVLKAAAQGAKTENADLTTVSDALTSAMTDYHLPASAAADVTSKLVAATASGKMTFQDLAGSMSAILPVASAAHVSLNDILADEASMTMHGMSAQQASQNLADAVRHLQAPTGTMIDSFAKLGLNAQQISQDLGKQGLSGTVNEISNAITSKMGGDTTRVVLDLNNALKGTAQPVQDLGAKLLSGSISYKDFVTQSKALPPELRGQVAQINTMANSTHKLGSGQATGAQIMSTYAAQMRGAMGDATGMNVALMIGGENAGNTANAFKAVSGATADAGGNVAHWGEIQQTFNQKLSEAKDGLGSFAIGVGSVLLPVVSAILGPLGAVAGYLGSHRGLAIALAVILTTMLVAGLVMVTVWLWSTVAAAFALDGALAPLAAAILAITWPMVAIAAAVALLVAGLIWAWNSSETFRNIVEGAFNAVKAVVGAVVGFVSGLISSHWDSIVAVTRQMHDEVTDLWNLIRTFIVARVMDVMNFVQSHWEQIHAITRVIFGAIKVTLGILWAEITLVFSVAISVIGGIVRVGWAAIIGGLYIAWDVFKTAFQLVWDVIGTIVKVAVDFIGGIIKVFSDLIHGNWSKAWTDLKDMTKNILGDLVSGIGSIFVDLWHNLGDILGDIWDTFKSIFSGLWGMVAGIFKAGIAFVVSIFSTLNTAIKSATGIDLGAVFTSIFNGIIAAAQGFASFFVSIFHGIGAVFSWLWHNIVEPTFNGIVTVLKWAGAIIFTILVAPFVLAFNLLKGPALELWHGVIEPAMHGIAAVFRWLYDSTIKVVSAFIKMEIQGVANIWNWFYTSVWVPITNAVAAIWHWLYDNAIKPVGDFINAALRLIGTTINWLHDNVWVPVINALSATFHWLYDNAVKPVGDFINAALRLIGTTINWLHDNVWVPVINAMAAVFHWLYDTVIKPVGDTINTVVHSIGQAFSDTVDWIKRTWQTVQDIVSVPVKFVVNTIYGKGIKPTWDAIAGVFGLPPAPPAPAFAAGGIVGDDSQGGGGLPHAAMGRVMPGHEPGHDRYTIHVGGGEAVMRPEWTRMMERTFGPGAIHLMNHEASSGRHPMFGVGGRHPGNNNPRQYAAVEMAKRRGPLAGGVSDSPFAGHFAAGGIAGGGSGPDLPIPPVPGNGPDVSLGGAVLKSFGNLLMIPELITNPKGYFDGIFKPFVDPLNGMGSSRFMQSMKDVPAKAIDGIVQKVKDWISSMMSGGATIGPESASHAADIVAAAHAKGLHHDAAVIAIMTGLQESGLRELANPNVPASMALPHEGVGTDHDSVGIFQQRQSWGPTPLLMNPFGSAELFYNRLGGGPYGDFGAAAQRVQVSAFPGAYSKWQGQATGLAGPNFASGGVVGVSGGLPFGGFRALGGSVSPGAAYMVGEQGPELVAPSSPGTVVPADITAGLGGDGSTPTPENLGHGRRGDVHFAAGSIVVNAANDPQATAQAVADAVSDRMARQ